MNIQTTEAPRLETVACRNDESSTAMNMEFYVAQCAPIVVRAYEGNVWIWNLDTGEQLSKFPTVHDGCGRLAISPSGETVVAANWRKGQYAGAACYETKSGRRIWHRPDLQQIQHMRFSAQGDWLWCNVESRPVHCLDAKNGSTLKIWKTVRDVLDSPYSPHLLLARLGDFVIGGPGTSISVPSFCRPRIEAAFSPDAVCLSEYFHVNTISFDTRCIVRCIESESGGERWRYQSPDNHFMQLISYQDDQHLYCVQSGNEQKAWIVALIRLSIDKGICTQICRLDSPPPYFGGFGDGVLVTPEGKVVSLRSGEIIRRLVSS